MLPTAKFAPILFSEAEASLPSSKFRSQPGSPPSSNPVLVVLDDDPTGTQTVHDITVLTTFECDVFIDQLETNEPGFFILTNSRAYGPEEAELLLTTVLRNLRTACQTTGRAVDLVLRSDSTLRGHFPLENELAESFFGPYDAWILAPAFFEGGRVTLDGVHYALDSHDQKTLMPVGDTPSAKDKGFGFRSSHMKEWTMEKMQTDIDFVSISVDMLRSEDAAERVAHTIKLAVEKRIDKHIRTVIVPDTFAPEDMMAFVAGCNLLSQVKLLYRTAASFVSSWLRIERMPPLQPSLLFNGKVTGAETGVGGLVIIGSYVPRTSAQREYLLKHCKTSAEHIELNVEEILRSDMDANRALIERTAASAEKALLRGRDAIVSTSRKLITSDDGVESLRIGGRVTETLVEVTKAISVRPKYVIAKVIYLL